MNLKEKSLQIDKILTQEFPNVETPLLHSNEYQLLVATMLSAQTLDTTTNKVTPSLFKVYPTVFSLALAQENELASIIKIVNYYKTKAKNLIKMANILVNDFQGNVPDTLEQLIKLPGVGRKIANVVISEWFARHILNKEPEGFVVDTHVKRVSYRLGLTIQKDPAKIEKDLMVIFPKDKWVDTSLRFIFHGRKICKSQKPLCYMCPLKEICPKIGVSNDVNIEDNKKIIIKRKIEIE